ncbi:pilus assembly protein TadG-related protein [Croceicoccus sp. BE223]|uniref:pilus assembly protein TadG-related protein n=1 Tax=Croceicoccus sp. BE223 TaxID=2817716 RepID=UPI00285A8C43|nr:pilus assembly protein TadG-related protein [Croceicoccus sp. BE223]MDR7103298.1 Flp pilus assembly protein TadG [Croceicoccus sp. BE223]
MILHNATNRARRFFRSFRKDTSANALILAAFGAPMIVGGGGFAVDFAQYYLWKRELQFAADQAAIAAAWDLANNPSSTTFVARGLTEFGTNESVTKDFNTTPSIVRSNYAGEIGNAVSVTVEATKMLPFTSYFTRSATTVSIYSQAAFTGGLRTTECLKAVDPHDSGVITFNGNPVFTAGCGIAALSDSKKICVTAYDDDGLCVDKADGTSGWEGEDAIIANGTPTIEAGTIVTAGTVDDEIELLTDDLIIENFGQLYDQFADLVPPIDKVTTNGSYECKSVGGGKGKGSDSTKKIGVATPGIYPNGLKVSCDTTFQSGIYVIKNADLDIGGNYSTIGSDILFILMDGAGIQIVGTSVNGTSNQINLQGITYDTLIRYGVDTASAERMTGMLVYEDPESPGNNPSGEGLGNKFAGTSTTWISGTVYLPKSTLSLAGTANVANICLTIIANKINMNGTVNMSDFCPEGESHEEVVFLGTVRLVG